MSNLVRFSLPLSFPGRISDPQTEQGMAEGETIETQTAGNQFLPLINQVLQSTIVSPHNPRLENTSGGQSEASIQVTWPVFTNQRPVLENTSADPGSEAQKEQIFPAEGEQDEVF